MNYGNTLSDISSPSIHSLRSIFPELHSYTLLDFYCKWQPVTYQTGNRLDSEDVYGRDPKFPEYRKPFRDLIFSLQTNDEYPVSIAYGKVVQVSFYRVKARAAS